MNLEPLDDRIVLQRLAAQTTTKGGIVIPEVAKEKPQQAKVIAVGPGARLESGWRAPLAIKVGDTVLIPHYSGDEVKVDEEELLIMRESDVLARVEE